MAFWKIDGFVVTPLMPSSSISFCKPPDFTWPRVMLSCQMLCPRASSTRRRFVAIGSIPPVIQSISVADHYSTAARYAARSIFSASLAAGRLPTGLNSGPARPLCTERKLARQIDPGHLRTKASEDSTEEALVAGEIENLLVAHVTEKRLEAGPLDRFEARATGLANELIVPVGDGVVASGLFHRNLPRLPCYHFGRCSVSG